MIGQGEGIQFNGVKAKSVDRLWDQFQAADARLSSAISGRADSRMRWLTAVENTLVDGPRGVGQLITKFFNSGVQLAANPRIHWRAARCSPRSTRRPVRSGRPPRA